MSKQTQNGQNKNYQQTDRPRLIFVGENKFYIKKAEKFAKNNGFHFHSYSEEEWATLEEIDQYIQEEELSKQIVTLPTGRATVSSLDETEAEAIKRVIGSVNGNVKKAARLLKIARATLYRKIHRYGLNVKAQRKKYLKEKEKTFKRAA